MMLAGNEEPSPIGLTPEDQAAIALSRVQSARGEFVTDEKFTPFGRTGEEIIDHIRHDALNPATPRV